jgi:TolB-like protein
VPGSIAVLPFVNMSPDAEDEYLSDGLTEELISVLSRLSGLRVTARTSAFAFKGQNLDVRRIGDSLGVATVLEGSVRKAADRWRVSAQLINVADGYHDPERHRPPDRRCPSRTGAGRRAAGHGAPAHRQS